MPVLIQPRKRTQLHDPIFLSPQVIRHPEPRNIGIRRIIIKGFNLTEYVRCFIPSLTKILQENCLFIIIHVELCPPVIQVQGIARCYFVIHLAIDTGTKKNEGYRNLFIIIIKRNIQKLTSVPGKRIRQKLLGS